MSLVNKYIMLSTEEYFKLFHVVDKMEDIGGYIVQPIGIVEGLLYGGYKGPIPKEVLSVPDLIEAEDIFIFDDIDSLREWQNWLDSPSEEISKKPKLNVVPITGKPSEE